MAKIYDRIVIIGYGVIVKSILEIVNKYKEKYAYDVEYIEHEVYPFNSTKKIVETNKIIYQKIEDKTDLLNHFFDLLNNNRLLIVSASNNYIFPVELVDNENATIVNFHNALLPAYPGRNAPSWAIYKNEKVTGITWHYVSSEVDAGDIIIQKKTEITPDMKAYELVEILMRLAADAFDEIYENILTDCVCASKQEKSISDRKIYKSYEVPGGGEIDLNDNPEDIYRLLRSIDYGKNDIFLLPTARYKGKKIEIKRYKVVFEKNEKENTIFLPFRDMYLMLKYKEVFGQ